MCSYLKNVANIKFKLYIKSFTCKLINHTKKCQVSDMKSKTQNINWPDEKDFDVKIQHSQEDQ